jgi:hypothetical protein
MPPVIAACRVEREVFSIRMRNTLEKSGIPLAVRHTGILFAVPQVVPEGHAPHGEPLDDVLVLALVLPPLLALLLALPPVFVPLVELVLPLVVVVVPPAPVVAVAPP